MKPQEPQNFQNHAVISKPFLVVLFLLLVSAVMALVASWRMGFQLGPVLLTLAVAINSVCTIVGFFLARINTTKLQDRVIRTEMRLRLERILPPALKPKINELTVPQLIGLRFASDEEMPELMEKVLREKITKVTPIKQLVKNWVPDHHRV